MGGRDPKSLVRAIGEGSHWTQGTDRGIIRNSVQKIRNTLFNLSRFQASWKSKKAYWTRSLPYNLWMDLLLYLTAYYIIFVVHNWYNFVMTTLVSQSDLLGQLKYTIQCAWPSFKQLLLQTNILIFSFVLDKTKKCEDDTDDNGVTLNYITQRVIKYFDENITILSKVITQSQ